MSTNDDLMKVVLTQNDDMAWRIVHDECIIVDPQGSTATVLNPLGARIWELIDGKRTLGDVVDQIVAEYDVTRESADADAREFVQQLLDSKLVLR